LHALTKDNNHRDDDDDDDNDADNDDVECQTWLVTWFFVPVRI